MFGVQHRGGGEEVNSEKFFKKWVRDSAIDLEGTDRGKGCEANFPLDGFLFCILQYLKWHTKMAQCIYTKSASVAVPKWRSILDQVVRKLEAGGFAESERFYTIRELAAKHDVSVITAQRVFRELTTRGLIETQGRRGTRLRKPTRVETVHVCLRDDHFSTQGGLRRFQSINTFLDGVRSDANGQFSGLKPIGLRFFLRNLNVFESKPVLISANAFLDLTSDRIRLDQELLARVVKTINPVVFHCFSELPGATQVIGDLYGGIQLAVDHLAEAGHERFGLLTGPPENVWFRPRFQGFMDGLLDRGLPFEPDRIKITSGNDRDEDFRAIEAMLAAPRPPTAVVCVNDMRALHVLEYCAAKGIVVPEALAVTGYDNIPEGALSRPALTTIDGRNFEMGQRCADLLLKRMQDRLKEPAQVHVEPKLIVRASG